MSSTKSDSSMKIHAFFNQFLSWHQLFKTTLAKPMLGFCVGHQCTFFNLSRIFFSIIGIPLNTITSYISKTMLCEIFHHSRWMLKIFCKIMSNPHNIVLVLNNIMTSPLSMVTFILTQNCLELEDSWSSPEEELEICYESLATPSITPPKLASSSSSGKGAIK